MPDDNPSGRIDPTESVGRRAPGWPQVLLVGAIVVGVVLALEVLTSALPASLQDVVFRTPLAIVVLVAGTLAVLAWSARRSTPRP